VVRTLLAAVAGHPPFVSLKEPCCNGDSGRRRVNDSCCCCIHYHCYYVDNAENVDDCCCCYCNVGDERFDFGCCDDNGIVDFGVVETVEEDESYDVVDGKLAVVGQSNPQIKEVVTLAWVISWRNADSTEEVVADVVVVELHAAPAIVGVVVGVFVAVVGGLVDDAVCSEANFYFAICFEVF
jgi:hypothetical protein